MRSVMIFFNGVEILNLPLQTQEALCVSLEETFPKAF